MTLPHPLRASTRRAMATTSIGIVLVSLGVLAGSGPAIGDQSVATTLGYTCQFPSGAQQVRLSVKATFPETGAVDTPIAPTDVTADLVVPQVALGDLTTIKAASVTAKADLSVVVKHNGDTRTSTWSNLTAPSTPLPSTGDLTISLAGNAAPVTETDAGSVTFAADAIGLLLTPLTSTGAGTTPATMAVACTLNPNQRATLATVTIPTLPGTATSTAPSTPNQPSAGPHKQTVKPRDQTYPPDPACNQPGGSESLSGDYTQLSAMLLGRTNVNKLNESTVTDGIAYLVNTEIWISDDFTTFILCYVGNLDLNPTTATILGFGFIPITTTLTYVQANTPDNPMFVDASTDSTYPDGHPSGHSTALVNIFVSSASINGTPLNVGPNCRTRTPVSLSLSNLQQVDASGNEIYPYNGASGGYLQGTVDVPTFTGCGVDDNLDTLLSAPVSGPDNLTRICQGTAADVSAGPPTPPNETDNHCKAP